MKKAFLHWVTEEARAFDPGYDPGEAQKMLMEEGYTLNRSGILEKDGEELAFDLYVPTGWTDWITAADVIGDQLGQIGIRVRVAQRAWPSPFLDNLRNGEYAMSIGYATSGSSPFFQFDNILHSRHYAPVGTPSSTHSQVRYTNPEVDEALETFITLTDEDEDKRVEVMGTVIYEFMKDTPFVPLFFNPVWFQYNTKNFTGWPTKTILMCTAIRRHENVDLLNLQPVN